MTAKFLFALVCITLLSATIFSGHAADLKVLQASGAESLKFSATQVHTLSDPDGFTVQGDYLLAAKAEVYAAYQITFDQPGEYVLYFKAKSPGFRSDSIFLPTRLGNNPAPFGKWDGLRGSGGAATWIVFAAQASDGVLPTNAEGASANSDLPVAPFTVAEAGTTLLLVTATRETGVQWQEFVLSRNATLTAAQLEALPFAATAPGDPVDMPFRIIEDFPGEDGYRLWLRYEQISTEPQREDYQQYCSRLFLPGNDPALQAAREELQRGLNGLLFGQEFTPENETAGTTVTAGGAPPGQLQLVNTAGPGVLVVGTPQSNPDIAALNGDLANLRRDGYLLRTISTAEGDALVLAANQPLGVLYGSFALLRHIQTRQPLEGLDIRSMPDLDYRVLNHWDNSNGSVERGYAGDSLFWGSDKWQGEELTPAAAQRLKDYARACASIGLNVAVLNNVNASSWNLSSEGLARAAAIADILRPYGIRIGLVPLFDLPIESGGLDTADPTDPAVIAWWDAKVAEIYALIPDFAGFLAKADSEGRPGPHAYGLTHAHGANMLANALEPYGGIVMWRSFSVRAPDDYPETPSDNENASWSWKTFAPLNGDFVDNAFVQSKNGPRDFQPREIYNPLFSTLTETQSMMELQVTQEYLGHEIHLVFLAEMWREVLDTDTHVEGPGSTVARIIDGSLFDFGMTGMAGVANAGDVRNWTGHHLLQANWYAFGRLAWDIDLSAETLAWEWSRMTFGNDPTVAATIADVLLGSYETAVNYRHPLGNMMGIGNDAAALELTKRSHYGPKPPGWFRPSQTAVGEDRTESGTNMVAQFPEPLRVKFSDPATCPLEYLLFFHRLSWDHQLANGRTVWEELVFRYNSGVLEVEEMREQWNSLQGKIDERRWEDVAHRLNQQVIEARRWRNAYLQHFSEINGKPLPALDEEPSP